MMDLAKIEAIRKDFPQLKQTVRGKPLIYLDNAATTLKPQCVVDAVANHYALEASNIHRGVHYFSELATQKYEQSREDVRKFINAKDVREVIFTSGTTQSINLVAYSFGSLLSEGDEIIISGMEHHSNIVPWQLLCERKGLKLRVVPINDLGELDFNSFLSLLSPKTKLVSMVYISNALGTINPVTSIITESKKRGIPVLLDAAQAVAHTQVDVQSLDVDFLAFSSHKLFGPTGVGVLYGKAEHLERMPPFLGGGDMIRSVTFEKTTFAPLPAKFEAGTPNIAGAIGLGAAINYVQSIGLKAIAKREDELLKYGTEKLRAIKDLRFVGEAKEKTSILGFTLGDVHPHDLGSLLDQDGIAIRAGHHCAEPVMRRFGVPATARASLAFYNTTSELDHLYESLVKIQRMFA